MTWAAQPAGSGLPKLSCGVAGRVLGVVPGGAVPGRAGLLGARLLVAMLVVAMTGDVAGPGLDESVDVGGKAAGEVGEGAALPTVAVLSETEKPGGGATVKMPGVPAVVHALDIISARPMARRRMDSTLPDRF